VCSNQVCDITVSENKLVIKKIHSSLADMFGLHRRAALGNWSFRT